MGHFKLGEGRISLIRHPSTLKFTVNFKDILQISETFSVPKLSPFGLDFLQPPLQNNFVGYYVLMD
jgi:hypothetical protein